MKKIISLLLCLIFLFSAVMPTAWADYAYEEGDDGESAEQYEDAELLMEANEAEDGGEIDAGDEPESQTLYPQFEGDYITDDDNNVLFTAYSFVGDSLGLSVTAESSGILTYQWQKLENDGNYYDLPAEQYPGTATNAIIVNITGAMIHEEKLFACVVTATDGTDTETRTAFFTITPYLMSNSDWTHGQVGFAEFTRTGSSTPDIDRTIQHYDIATTLGGATETDYKRINLTYANTSGTENTVLLVDLTTLMGCRFEQIEDWSANTSIKSIAYSSDFKKMAVQLKDSTTSLSGGQIFSFSFNLMYTPLTDEECDKWRNCTEADIADISGNFLAYEYQMPSAYSGNFSGFATALFGGTLSISGQSNAWYFWTDSVNATQRNISPNTPANYNNEDITVTHNYKVAVNPVPEITNYQLGADGYIGGRVSAYGDGYNEPARLDIDPERNCLAYGFTMPTVSGTVPLIEITQIKIYSPANKLRLDGIAPIQYQGYVKSVVKESDFYRFWNAGWEVDDTLSDPDAGYYVLTPESGKHFFNNGDAAHSAVLTYGFAPIWSLKDDNDPLPYDTNSDESARDYYTNEGSAQTEITYAVREGCAATGRFNCDAPKVYSYIVRTMPDGDTVNYWRQISQTECQINPGESVTNEGWTSVGNAAYYLKDENTGKVSYYQPNDHFQSVTQTYQIPYEIKLTKLKFYDSLYTHRTHPYHHNVTGKATTQLVSFKYKFNDDSTWYDADAGWVTAFNTYLATDTLGAYTGAQAEATISYDFTAHGVDDDTYITDVKLEWSNVGIKDYYGTNWINMGMEVSAFSQSSRPSAYGVNLGTYSIRTNADYTVRTTHEDGSAYIAYEPVQVQYEISYSNSTNNYDSYLFWQMKPKTCPSLVVRSNTFIFWNSAENLFADGRTNDLFNTALSISRNAEEDIQYSYTQLENFKFRYTSNSSTELSDCEMYPNRYSGYSGFNETLNSFFTGQFTLTTAMNDWHVEYTTRDNGSTVQYYPTQGTSFSGYTEDFDIQLPIDDDDCFTDILFVCDLESFDCDYHGVNADCFDGNNLVLIRRNYICQRERNPLKVGNPYYRSRNDESINGNYLLYVTGYWNNCSGHGNAYHNSANGCKSGAYLTIKLQFYRTNTLNAGTTSTDSSSSVLQGSGVNIKLNLPVKQTLNDGGNYQDLPFITFDNLESSKNYTVWIPWKVNESVYVELIDPEFTPDILNCSLFGATVASGNAEGSIVTIGGKRFVKLRLADGYVRNICEYSPGDDKHDAGCYIRNYNADVGGEINIAFVADIEATIGAHTPIGQVYLDYTDLLDNFNGTPNTVDFWNGTNHTDRYNTKYFINGNADVSEIDPSSSGENELFKYDFSDLNVSVSYAGTVGAALRAGAEDLVDNTTPISSKEYRTEDKDTLFARFTYRNDSIAKNSFQAIVQIPKQGVAAPYIDSATQLCTSPASDRSLYLTGVCTDYSSGTALSQYYTTAADPFAAAADWTYNPTASGCSFDNVTGVKLDLGEVSANGKKDVRIPLRSDVKTNANLDISYMGAYFTSAVGTTDPVVESSYTTLSQWKYLNYEISGKLFHDENESGEYETGEPVYSKTVLLYHVNDDDSLTFIDSAVSSATDGSYTLNTYEYLADKNKLVFILPGNEAGLDSGWQTKPTKQSESIAASGADSDFPRDSETRTYTYPVSGSSVTASHYTSELLLPRIPTTGLQNVTGGYIYLPKLSCSDQSTYLASLTYHATVETHGNKPDVSSEIWDSTFTPAGAYRITYSDPADNTIGTVTGPNGEAAPYVETAYGQDVTFTPTAAGGETTATVSVTNRLGDIVTVTYNINSATTCSLKITNVCTNAKPNQQFVYSVTDFSGRTMEVVVPANQSVTITGAFIGNATVTQNGWSWRCTPDNASLTQKLVSDSTAASNTFTFTNTTASSWLSGNSAAVVNVHS